MSGGPLTQTAVTTMLKDVVDVLEALRTYADGTSFAGDSGKLEDVITNVDGQYPPEPMTAWVNDLRASMSAMLSPGVARAALDPIMLEWGRVISADATDGKGGAYTDMDDLLEAIYEFMVTNSDTVESRGITFDSSPQYGLSATNKGTNTGDGVLRRLTVDENGYELEACTVEKKYFRCRRDANTGGEAEAEIFEVMGSALSDIGVAPFLRLATGGSGVLGSIPSFHAGGGAAGSLLANGSFDDFASGTSTFTSWTKSTASNSTYTRNTSEKYRGYPTEPSTTGSAEFQCRSGDTMTLKQSVEDIAGGRLNPNRPYFLRVMVKGDGSQATGNVNLRLGSQTATLAVTSVTTSWQELLIPLDANCWFKNFNQDEDTSKLVEIEWAGGTAGSIYFDDAILQELVRIDGTYWVLTQNKATPVRWLQDDLITVEDSFDSAYGTGKIQTWIHRAYNRYLPHLGTPTITDP